MRNIILIFLFNCIFFGYGQKTPGLGSIQQDSVKCRVLDGMIEKEEDPRVWLKYNQQMMDLANSNLAHLEGKARVVYLKYLASGLNNKGFYFQGTGLIDSALKFFKQSLDMRYDIKDREGVANSLNNIGHVYYKLGDFSKASNFYNKAIRVQEELRDSAGLATTYNNLGSLYDLFKKPDEALSLFNKSLVIRKGLRDSAGEAFCYNNIAKVYGDKGDYEKSLEFQVIALHIREALHSGELGTSYNNIGMIYLKLGDNKKAQIYLEKALALHKSLQDRQSEAVSYKNLGLLYQSQSNAGKAITCFENALAIAKDLGYPDDMFRPAKGLYELYKEKRNYRRSLEMYELYQQLKDSLAARKQAVVFFEAKEIKVADTAKRATPGRESVVIVESSGGYPVCLFVGSFLILIILGLLFYIFRRKR